MFPTRLQRGAGLPAVERLAYFPELASVQLEGLEHLVLVDAKAPVSFFAYPGKQSYLVPDGCEVHELAAPDADVVGEPRGAGRGARRRAARQPGAAAAAQAAAARPGR